MKRLSIATIVCGLLWAGSGTHGLMSAKPLNYTPASVAFRDYGVDGSMDKIMSDGLGAYLEGVRGSVCRIFTGGSQDLTLGTYQSGRKLRLFYAPAAELQQPTLNPPSGLLVDNSFVNVNSIGAMRIGEAKVTPVQFNTAVGLFRWSGLSGSMLAFVVRNSRTNWTVSTDPLQAGAGDIGVLMQAYKNTYKPAGLYHMPFGLDVNCPACPEP